MMRTSKKSSGNNWSVLNKLKITVLPNAERATPCRA